MDGVLIERLEHVDRALTQLTDSIASYNPSVPAATELIAADEQLTRDIRQLATHQENHSQIQTLRATVSTLDSTVKNSLMRLASVREDVLSIPLTTPQAAPKPIDTVKYQDLLGYASKISRYTVPPRIPNGIPPGPTARGPQDQVSTLRVEEESAGGETSPQSPHLANSSNEQSGFGVKQLQEAEVQWLHPERLVPFVPWPTEEVIQRGALAAIERGETSAVNHTEDHKNEDKVKDVIAQGHGVNEVLDKSRQAGQQSSQQSAMRNESREEKPKVFGGLDLYDPDMEG